jgi:hypothetical protein
MVRFSVMLMELWWLLFEICRKRETMSERGSARSGGLASVGGSQTSTSIDLAQDSATSRQADRCFYRVRGVLFCSERPTRGEHGIYVWVKPR